jgi:hypothetical protein
MDDRPRAYGRGTELGLQTVSLAFRTLARLNPSRQSESARKIPLAVHESQIGRASSISPSAIGRLRSGNMHATSYCGSSRPFAPTAVTRRNVHRRSGALGDAPGRGKGVLNGRGITAMAGTVPRAIPVQQGNQQY